MANDTHKLENAKLSKKNEFYTFGIKGGRGYVNGKMKYSRIFIKRK